MERQNCIDALSVWASLKQIGFAPERSLLPWQLTHSTPRCRRPGRASWSNVNLLPLLCQAWQQCASGTRRRQGMLAWCDEALACGAKLEIWPDGLAADRIHLVWWPRGVPDRCRIALLSSRPREAELQFAWRRHLRHMLQHLAKQRTVLCTSPGTTCDPWIRSWARAHQQDVLSVELARQSNGTSWRRHLTKWQPCLGPNEWTVCVSPAVAGDSGRLSTERKPGTRGPLADRWMCQLADQSLVVYVRPDGSIQELLQQERKQLVATAAGKGVLTSRRTGGGCGGRRISRIAQHDLNQKGCVTRPLYQIESQGDLLTSQTLLLHTTRSISFDAEAGGPWWRQPKYQHGPLAGLMAILESRMIRASSAAIRDGARVVCWTSRSLAELLERRVYRRHRHRWDFEPFGIAIRRERLSELGARPVIYGDQPLWGALVAEDRPFFQVQVDRTGKHDWTKEAEWRTVGDLHLDRLPVTDWFAFVPSPREAQLVADQGCSVFCLESQELWQLVCSS